MDWRERIAESRLSQRQMGLRVGEKARLQGDVERQRAMFTQEAIAGKGTVTDPSAMNYENSMDLGGAAPKPARPL